MRSLAFLTSGVLFLLLPFGNGRHDQAQGRQHAGRRDVQDHGERILIIHAHDAAGQRNNQVPPAEIIGRALMLDEAAFAIRQRPLIGIRVLTSGEPSDPRNSIFRFDKS